MTSTRQLSRRSVIASVSLAVLVTAACSSKSSGSGTLPAGAVTFSAGQAPSGLPSSCTGYTYVVIQDTALCSTDVYILCDGTTFGAYDCSLPPGYTPYSGGHADAGNDATSMSKKDAGSSSGSGSAIMPSKSGLRTPTMPTGEASRAAPADAQVGSRGSAGEF